MCQLKSIWQGKQRYQTMYREKFGHYEKGSY